MFKCEVCGGFHDESESEVVVIKMVKGKDCELKNMHARIERVETLPLPPAAPQQTSTFVPRKKVIPPDMLKFMMPPADQTPPTS